MAHLALAVVFGAMMTYVFGLLSWNRMERLYGKATGQGVVPHPRPMASGNRPGREA